MKRGRRSEGVKQKLDAREGKRGPASAPPLLVRQYGGGGHQAGAAPLLSRLRREVLRGGV